MIFPSFMDTMREKQQCVSSTVNKDREQKLWEKNNPRILTKAGDWILVWT